MLKARLLDSDLLQEQLPAGAETATITHTQVSRHTDAPEPPLLSKPHGGDIITEIYSYHYHFQSVCIVTLGYCAVCARMGLTVN